MSVATYLDMKKLIWCHVANERKTTHRQGHRLKRKGVKAGVPDCLIFNPKGKYNGLAIELKIAPNKPTEKQMEWLTNLRVKGWYTCVCYSIGDVIKVVDEYLSL